MEKYNVCHQEEIAQGGEYDVQEGFGWTNGVTLALSRQILDC
jgi:alpha,alpha-trehalase